MRGVLRRRVWSLESDLLLFIFLQIASQSSRLVLKSIGALDGVGEESTMRNRDFWVPIPKLFHSQHFSVLPKYLSLSSHQNAQVSTPFPVWISPENLSKRSVDCLVSKGFRGKGSELFQERLHTGTGVTCSLCLKTAAWLPLLTPSVSIDSLLVCMGCAPSILSIPDYLAFPLFPSSGCIFTHWPSCAHEKVHWALACQALVPSLSPIKAPHSWFY